MHLLPDRLVHEGTFKRPEDLDDRTNPAVLFGRSYLLTRTVVGIVGILLPIVFIIGEAYFLRAGVHVRGSISAYYHTGMRDIFVGGLCVIGFMLVTYMSGQSERTDFKLSLLSGAAVLGVAFFPTGRPNLTEGEPRCGTEPVPAGCSPVQQQFGEAIVATIHFVSAAVFIVSLALTCFYFAHLERKYERNAKMVMLQVVCGWLILGAIAWAVIGGLLDATVWELTPLYIAEVVAVWAFAASWLATGRDLWKRLFRTSPRKARA